MSMTSILAKLFKIDKAKKEIKKALEGRGADTSNLKFEDYTDTVSNLNLNTTIVVDRTLLKSQNSYRIYVICLNVPSFKVTAKSSQVFQHYENLRQLRCETIDFSDCTNMSGEFFNCRKLELIRGEFVGIKENVSLIRSEKLDRESVLVVIRGLYDHTGDTTRILTLNTKLKALLTDEDRQLCIDKNWDIA